MSAWTNSPKYYLTLSSICLLIAFISLSGLFFMKEDLVGRLVFGFTWGLVAIAWLGKYFQSKHI